MPDTIRTREDSWDVGAEFGLPDVVDVSAEAVRVVEQDTLELHSDYYDTAGFDLLRSGITLRRRIGPVDPGWDVVVADAAVRTEIPLPDLAAEEGVPGAARDLLVAARRGRPLVHAAELLIRRDVAQLTTSDGRLLATVSDDTVTPVRTSPASPAVPGWREVDVRLDRHGTEELLAAIGQRLADAGARRRAGHSKLRRLMTATPRAVADPGQAEPRTVGEVVAADLADQHAEIVRCDVLLRAGEDAVRPARRAVNRYLCTLHTFAELFHAARAASLTDDLAWFGSLLDEVHARDVLRAHLADLAELTAVDDWDLDATAAVHETTELLGHERDRHQAAVTHALGSERYRHLVDQLGEWRDAPPTTGAADDSPTALFDYLRAAGREVDEAMHRVDLDDADDLSLRRLRLAVARGRSAARLTARLPGPDDADPRPGTWSTTWELLSLHHEATTGAVFLRGMAPRSQGNAFALGALYAIERRTVDDARDELRALADG